MTGIPRPARSSDFWTTAVVIIAIATGVRWWVMQGTWFFFDDLHFIERAYQRDLTWGYLLTPYNGHLMPSATALTWLNTRLAPLNYTLAMVQMTAGFALAVIGMLRLSVTLFGRRWGALVPVVLFAFSPFLIPATTWWAAAINQLPMLIAMTFGLAAFVRHLRAPSTRTLIAHLAWFALGISFGERAVVAFGLAWLLALLYFAHGNLVERVTSLAASHRRTFVVHVVLVLAYVSAYLKWAANFDLRQAATLPLFEVLRNLIWSAFGPATMGGPLGFETSRVTQQMANAPRPFLLISWLLLIGLGYLAWVRDRRSIKAWLIPGAVLILNGVLISTSRAIYFGPELALDYRFQTESALAFALAVGLAFLPVVGEVNRPDPAPGPVPTKAVAVGLIVVAVLSTITASRYPLRDLGERSPRNYLRTVAAEAHRSPDTVLLNLQVPPWVWAPTAFPANTYKRVFRPLDLPISYGPPVTDQITVVDEQGKFVPADLNVVRRMLTFTPDACNPVGTAPVTFKLDGPVIGFGWFLRVEYTATVPGRLHLNVGDSDHTVKTKAGNHTVLVLTEGAYDSLTASLPPASPADPGFCIRRTEIGTAQ